MTTDEALNEAARKALGWVAGHAGKDWLLYDGAKVVMREAEWSPATKIEHAWIVQAEVERRGLQTVYARLLGERLEVQMHSLEWRQWWALRLWRMYYACRAKRRYATQQEATAKDVHTYQCRYCRGWHRTTKKKTSRGTDGERGASDA